MGICGSYGGLNVGDEAILTVALEQLREALPDVELTVFTRDAAHTRGHHDVDRVVDARTTLRNELCDEVGRLGLLLLGGGGILYDREAERYLHVPRSPWESAPPPMRSARGRSSAPTSAVRWPTC